MNGSDFIGYEPGRSPGGGGSGIGALPHTNSDGTVSREVIIDGQVWITINADWDGTQWVKDVIGYSASGYRFTTDGFSFFTQNGGVATWATYEWATETSLGTNGQIRSPGQINAVFCSEFMSATASGYLGGAVSFGKSFPSAPSSISFTTTYINGVTGGPNVSVLTNTGLGWYAAYSGLGDIFVGGYVSVS